MASTGRNQYADCLSFTKPSLLELTFWFNIPVDDRSHAHSQAQQQADIRGCAAMEPGGHDRTDRNARPDIDPRARCRRGPGASKRTVRHPGGRSGARRLGQLHGGILGRRGRAFWRNQLPGIANGEKRLFVGDDGERLVATVMLTFPRSWTSTLQGRG